MNPAGLEPFLGMIMDVDRYGKYLIRIQNFFPTNPIFQKYVCQEEKQDRKP